MPQTEGGPFLDELFGEDVLGIVVRTAIHLETLIITFIETNLEAPGELPSRMDFEDRLALALALGLDRRFKPALKAFAGIRNRFAHRLGTILTTQDISNFYRTLDAEEKNFYQQILGKSEKAESADLDRLRVMAASLYYGLSICIRRHAEARQRGAVIGSNQ